MNRLVRLSLSLALMAFPFVVCLLAEPNDEGDVRQVVSGFAETWNRHDLEAFGRLFAPDADFVNVGGILLKGRHEIQSHHAWSHGAIPESVPDPQAQPQHYGIFKNSTMKFDTMDVRFLRKDVALAHVNWQLSGDARTSTPRRGVFLFVLTRQDGSWLISAAQNTEINRTVK